MLVPYTPDSFDYAGSAASSSSPIPDQHITCDEVKTAFHNILQFFPPDHPKRSIVDKWIARIAELSNQHAVIHNIFHCQSLSETKKGKRCDFFHHDKTAVLEHAQSHLKSKPPIFHKSLFFCHDCPDYQTAKLRDLFQHVTSHLKNNTQLPCPDLNCDDNFNCLSENPKILTQNYLKHIATHIKTPLPCPHCDKVFVIKNLTTHLHQKHPTSKDSIPHTTSTSNESVIDLDAMEG